MTGSAKAAFPLGGELPWPRQWPPPVRRGLAILGVGNLLFAAIFIVLGASAALRGVSAAPLIILGGGVLGVVAYVLSVMALRGRRHRASAIHRARVAAVESEALVVRYARRSLVGLIAILLPLSPVLALGGIGFLVLPDSGIPFWARLLLGGALIAAAAVVVVALVEAAIGRLARGLLALTPAGIYHRARSYEVYLPWQSVGRVSATISGRPLMPQVWVSGGIVATGWCRRTSWVLREREATFDASMFVPAQLLPLDPAILYHGLHFYASNPAARAELGDQRGVERFRTGNFPAAPDYDLGRAR